jgi:hypothetical protein
MFLKVKIFLRCWRHTGQEKTARRGNSSTLPHCKHTHSSPTSQNTEKQGVLLCHQAPAPNLLGRLKGEKISGMWFLYSHTWEKST